MLLNTWFNFAMSNATIIHSQQNVILHHELTLKNRHEERA